MSGKSLFPVLWDRVPDPTSADAPNGLRVSVELREAHWRKIIGKHFSQKDHPEPWHDVLVPNDLATLLKSPYGPWADGPLLAVAVSVLRSLEHEVRRSLERPLALTYRSLEQIGETAQRSNCWHVILPSGAVAIIRRKECDIFLKTCYFTGAVAVIEVRRRWRRAAQRAVEEYSEYDEQRDEFIIPGPRHHKDYGTELRFDFRFATPSQWGFSGDGVGSCWLGVGALSDWESDCEFSSE